MSSSIIVSGTPHVRSKESIQSIMRDVVIALIPASVMGIYYFGIKALMLIAISIISAVVFEWGYEKILKKPITVNDFSAVLTGLLLALNLPATASWWVPVVGAFVAIVLGKQFYGGLGQNFINPALAGRAFLVASYPTEMTTWTAPVGFSGADAVAVATPLATLKGGAMPDASLMDVVFGNIGGCIGETCAIALIIGGIYLIVKHVISWKIPVIYIATVFILTAAIGRKGLRVPVYELFTGGLMLGAFFMATDYASSPVTPKGQVIFAIGCGLITTLIRIFGVAVPLIERFTEPKIFGALPKVKEAKKA